MRNKLYYVAFYFSSLTVVLSFVYLILNKIPISMDVFVLTLSGSLVVFVIISSIKNKMIIKFLISGLEYYDRKDIDYLGIPIDKKRDRVFHNYINKKPFLRNLLLVFCLIIILFSIWQIIVIYRLLF